MAKKGSKNNIANRGAAAQIKTINGKEVFPVAISNVNGKRIIGAKYANNEFVRDKATQAFVPFNKIPYE